MRKSHNTKNFLNASSLCSNIYYILDIVIATGRPIEINHKGKILRLTVKSPKTKKSKLSRLIERDVIIGDPEDLIYIDWMSDWKLPV